MAARSSGAAAVDRAEALKRHARKLAGDAEIVDRRHALYGWPTYQTGERIVDPKAKAAVATLAPSHDSEEE